MKIFSFSINNDQNSQAKNIRIFVIQSNVNGSNVQEYWSLRDFEIWRGNKREKHALLDGFQFYEAINGWRLPSHLCWANSMSILVTLLWCVPSFCAAFCLLMHSALRGARKTPTTSKLHPTTMRAVEFCAASAPGASCTKPTTNTTAPSSNEPTTTCNELTFEENVEKKILINTIHSFLSSLKRLLLSF